MENVIKNVEEMEKRATAIVRRLIKKHKGEDALIIGLSGDLGAGKTVFVKAAARDLGITATVTSPTFVIEKVYKLAKEPYSFLIHIDAYRLNSCEEMKHIGWDMLQKDPKNIIFVEWADRIEICMPMSTEWITIEHVSEMTRSIYHGGKKRRK